MSTYLNISDKIRLNSFTPGLLDDYSGAATAYSLRKLSTFYSGDAIIVTTNGTDSASIGFVNDELDIASLESFAGSGDAYVTTWYDQSGNGNHATQGIASRQPKIVSNGSVIQKFGKPAIEFDDTSYTTLGVSNYNDSDFLTGPSFAVSVSSYTGVGSSQYGTIWHIGATGSNGARIIANKYVQTSNQVTVGKYDGGYLFRKGGTVSPDTQYLNTFDYNGGTDVSFYNNNVLFNTTTGLSADLSTNLAIGGGGSISGNNWKLDGHIQEVIFYNFNQSSNRTEIESNINSYYSIY